MASTDAPVPAIALIFRYTPEQLRANQKAISAEYERLLKTCRDAGLVIAGKLGNGSESRGTVVLFVDCTDDIRRQAIVSWERAISSPSNAPSLVAGAPSPATFLRAFYTYLTLPVAQGGLDITPKSTTYPHLEQIFAPHIASFKLDWLASLQAPQAGGALGGIGYDDTDIARIGSLYGPPTALYFAFLTSYTRFLIFPAIIGVGLHFKTPAFVQHPVWSVALIGWAIAFVELWRSKAAKLSATFDNSPPVSPATITPSAERIRESGRVGNARKASSWYVTEAKTLVTLPLLAVSVGIIAFNMTVAFLLEAFVAKLYDGPFKMLAPLVPTVYNVLTTPPFVAVYSLVARKLVEWEGHGSQRAHDSSLLIKLLPVQSLVAFFALALSAGIYVPFGEELMSFFHITLFSNSPSLSTASLKNTDAVVDTILTDGADSILKNVRVGHAGAGAWHHHYHEQYFKTTPTPPPTNPHTRLGEQMFAFTLVLQLVPLVLEVVAPFAIRYALGALKQWKAGAKKESVKTESNEGSAKEVAERELVDTVLFEAGLPEHDFFNDYLTLVLQFGYLVMWSTTYPLTPAILLFLAFLRLRTDALKLLVHFKRSVPSRGAVDAANVWSGALTCVSWAGALTNAFLLLVAAPLVQSHLASSPAPPSEPQTHGHGHSHHFDGRRPHRFDVPAFAQHVKNAQHHFTTEGFTVNSVRSQVGSAYQSAYESFGGSSKFGQPSAWLFSPVGAAMIVLLASWAFIAVRWYAGHIVTSIRQDEDGSAKTTPTATVGAAAESLKVTSSEAGASIGGYPRPTDAFWAEDEGESEIWKKVI